MTKQQRILFQEQPEQIVEARERGQQMTVTMLKTIAEMPIEVRHLFHSLLFGKNMIKDCLYGDERRLLFYLYGVIDGEPRTYAEAAAHFNMTEEQVKEKESLALRKTCGYIDVDESLYAELNPKELPSEQDLLRVQKLRNTVLDGCSELERKIFLSYYGYIDEKLDGHAKAIAETFGITSKEVMRIVDDVRALIVEHLKLNF